MSTTTTVTASKIMDASGALLVSGRAIFRVVDANGNPMTVRSGGGGQVISEPVVAPVTNGLLSVQIVDVAQTSPSYACIELTIINNADDSVVWYDRTLQPTGTGFSLDNYATSTTPVKPLEPGQSLQGDLEVEGALTVTGTLSVGGFAAGAMTATSVTASGAVNGASVSASGTVSGATVSAPTVDATNINATGTVTAPTVDATTANVSGVLSAQHITGTGPAPTIILNGSGTGTGATVSLATGSNAVAGQITLTTGASGLFQGAVLILTIRSAVAAPNRQVLMITPSNSAATQRACFAGASNTIDAQLDAVSGLAASTTYEWNYLLVQI